MLRSTLGYVDAGGWKQEVIGTDYRWGILGKDQRGLAQLLPLSLPHFKVTTSLVDSSTCSQEPDHMFSPLWFDRTYCRTPYRCARMTRWEALGSSISQDGAIRSRAVT